MRTANPTHLSLGMTATFNGKHYRLVGRAVVGVVNNGVIYTWNEFNLETESGQSGTLVYGETDEGIQWRWFEMFDPQQPLSVEEAASKRPPDGVKLDGVTYFVSRADHSEVYYIEGKAPEGEKLGSQADYINAQALGKLLVVSWTGDEIEFYQGRNLSASMVAAAFNLQAAQLVKFHLSNIGRSVATANWGIPAFILVAAGLFFLILISCLPSSRPPAVVKYTAPASPLAIGSTKSLAGSDYRVVSHEVAQIAEEGMTWSRHEYGLQDDLGRTALLIFGLTPKNHDWLLLTAIDDAIPLSPSRAGNVSVGQTVHLGDVNATATELFRESRVSMEGAANSPVLQAGATSYGFIARTNQELFLVRWDADAIRFFHGHSIK